MKISLKEHVIFWLSKVLYFFFYVALPVALVGWQAWLVGYLIVNVTMGITLAIVFQLAHVVEKTSFEEAGDSAKMIEAEWAIHEINTTANFAPKNKIISWFVGGLNFQVEHHLFPRISHIHYPAISAIVEEQCKKFNIPYHYYPKMTQAIASHVRVMKRLGQKEIA
jgi:linoleoyl-CoA desaturase